MMKFLLAFGMLQMALALRTLDESQTVPENVQIQGKEVGYIGEQSRRLVVCNSFTAYVMLPKEPIH